MDWGDVWDCLGLVREVGVMNLYTKGSPTRDVIDEDAEAWDDPTRNRPSAS